MRGVFFRGWRIALAAAGAAAVTGISIGLAVTGSAGHVRTAKLTIRAAAPLGASASASTQSHSSPVASVRIARPSITPAIRDMRPTRSAWKTLFNKVGEHSRAEGLRVPDTHRGSALVQRSAPKGRMPTPIVNFPGVMNSDNAQQVHPPDTEGAIGP